MKSRRKKIRYSSAAAVIGVALLAFSKIFVSADTEAVISAGQSSLSAVFAVVGGLILIISASVLFSALAAKH